jgi:hypothetical protein
MDDFGSLEGLIDLGKAEAEKHKHLSVVRSRFLNGQFADPVPGLPRSRRANRSLS